MRYLQICIFYDFSKSRDILRISWLALTVVFPSFLLTFCYVCVSFSKYHCADKSAPNPVNLHQAFFSIWRITLWDCYGNDYAPISLAACRVISYIDYLWKWMAAVHGSNYKNFNHVSPVQFFKLKPTPFNREGIFLSWCCCVFEITSFLRDLLRFSRGRKFVCHPVHTHTHTHTHIYTHTHTHIHTHTHTTHTYTHLMQFNTFTMGKSKCSKIKSDPRSFF